MVDELGVGYRMGQVSGVGPAAYIVPKNERESRRVGEDFRDSHEQGLLLGAGLLGAGMLGGALLMRLGGHPHERIAASVLAGLGAIVGGSGGIGYLFAQHDDRPTGTVLAQGVPSHLIVETARATGAHIVNVANEGGDYVETYALYAHEKGAMSDVFVRDGVPRVGPHEGSYLVDPSSDHEISEEDLESIAIRSRPILENLRDNLRPDSLSNVHLEKPVESD